MKCANCGFNGKAKFIILRGRSETFCKNDCLLAYIKKHPDLTDAEVLQFKKEV